MGAARGVIMDMDTAGLLHMTVARPVAVTLDTCFGNMYMYMYMTSAGG